MLARSVHGKTSKKNFPPSFLVRFILCSLTILGCVGVFICVLLMPTESIGGTSTNSLINQDNVNHKRTLNEKLLDWIPVHHKDSVALLDGVKELPDWSKEFWTPIDIDGSHNPMVILCKLNFKAHWENPHSTPMFRDLEGISGCMGSNRRREKLSVLMNEIQADGSNPSVGRNVKPTGFVFHESRVGSTLVANLLALDPYSLVFSEATPIANAILHCDGCTRQEHIDLFRNVVTLMGRSSFHTRMFIKFQSITTTMMDIALEAFPQAGWAFVFRQPVQTMMSHLDPKKSAASAPCLRSKRSPPPQVRSDIERIPGASRENEAWCAAHLNMLCTHALSAYNKYNITENNIPRALLINYDSLPGIVPKVLLPLLGITPSKIWMKRMEAEAKHYSKSRGSVFRLFFGDSTDKEERASNKIEQFAQSYLIESYKKLNTFAQQSVIRLADQVPYINTDLLKIEGYDWRLLQKLDDFNIEPLFSMGVNQKKYIVDSSAINTAHSHALQSKEFVPWSPFANHHSSKSVERINCPLHPETNYPKVYSMLDLLNNWNSDVTDIPPFHYDSLCHFDHTNSTQLQQAFNYRAKEVPFILYNIPEVDAVIKKWNDLEYLSKLLGKKDYRTEASATNHFMYWHGGGRNALRGGQKWKPPTEIVSSKFEDWLELAVKGQNKSMDERVHRYFRVSSDLGNEWLYNELPFFKPVKSVFLVNPREQHGIHCRFGMRSVIAEAHFDGSRNSVVELGGLRRWIMTHPDQCKNMHMLPPTHPSGRHSEVDWSKPDLKAFPNFGKVQGNEVIIQPGDYLFVPTYWIHYIVSLNVNFQCNTRSGTYQGYNKFIRECGF